MSAEQVYSKEELERLDRLFDNCKQKANTARHDLDLLGEVVDKARFFGDNVPSMVEAELLELRFMVALEVIAAYEAREPLIAFLFENEKLHNKLAAMGDELTNAINAHELKDMKTRAAHATSSQSGTDRKHTKMTKRITKLEATVAELKKERDAARRAYVELLDQTAKGGAK